MSIDIKEVKGEKGNYFIMDEEGNPVASWTKRDITFFKGRKIKFDSPILVIPSKLANFIGVFHPDGDHFFFHLYDSEGNERWRNSYSMEEERIMDFYVTDMGIVISVEKGPLFLRLIDPVGNILRTFFLYENPLYDEERSLYIDVSEDGLKFTILTEKDQFSSSDLFLFNMKGKEIFKKKLDGIPGGVFISPHENYLFAISHEFSEGEVKKTYGFLFSKRGEIIKKFLLPIKKATFSKDESLLLISGKRWFELYSLPESELILRKRTDRKIYDTSISIDGSILILKATRVHSSSEFMYDWLHFTVFDKRGERLESGSIKGPPEITLIRGGWRTFYVSLRDKWVEINF